MRSLKAGFRPVVPDAPKNAPQERLPKNASPRTPPQERPPKNAPMNALLR
jgi:hypothetical protein